MRASLTALAFMTVVSGCAAAPDPVDGPSSGSVSSSTAEEDTGSVASPEELALIESALASMQASLESSGWGQYGPVGQYPESLSGICGESDVFFELLVTSPPLAFPSDDGSVLPALLLPHVRAVWPSLPQSPEEDCAFRFAQELPFAPTAGGSSVPEPVMAASGPGRTFSGTLVLGPDPAPRAISWRRSPAGT